MKRLRLILLALTLALLFGSGGVLKASPANLTLPWWTVDSGGGDLSEGSYTLAGTIGQPDAGPVLTSNGYTLVGGFWSGSGPTAAPEDYPIYLPLVLRNAS